jgi:hypothetical protein
MFPIMAAVQAGADILGAKKKQQEAQRTNAARAALGEAPTADPGAGAMGGLAKGIGTIADAMKNQPKPEAKPAPAPLPPVPGPKPPMYGQGETYGPQPMGNGPGTSLPPMAAGMQGMGDPGMTDNLLDYSNYG